MEDADRHDQIESLATLKRLLDDDKADNDDIRDAAIRVVNRFDREHRRARQLAPVQPAGLDRSGHPGRSRPARQERRRTSPRVPRAAPAVASTVRSRRSRSERRSPRRCQRQTERRGDTVSI